MPNRIHVLSDQLANQIAAGEVIDRPASIVKELVENALDAGATQIDLEAHGGGRHLVRVADNGCGMSRDDALLCLERHATSKLKAVEDLAEIGSYGFRGEALPSIASVSKFVLRTREKPSESGTEVRVDGGRLLDVKDAGMAPGTEIEVRALFFNVPARRKFLRSDATETAHVRHQAIVAALANPKVGIALRLDAGQPQRWPPGQDEAARIGAVLGQPVLGSLVPLEGSPEFPRVTGWVGKPGIVRSGRQDQFFFVNRRCVQSRAIAMGLQDGYAGHLARGLHPIAILFVDLAPSEVDVNVHPAKREVKFRDEFAVRQWVADAVAAALRRPDKTQFRRSSSSSAEPRTAPPLPCRERSTPEVEVPVPPPPSAERPVPGPAAPSSLEYRPPLQLAGEFAAPAPRQEILGLASSAGPAKSAMASPPRNEVAAGAGGRGGAHGRPVMRLLGSMEGGFLIGENDDGLVLIDQRAAHERVLYEKMMRRYSQQEVRAQKLLLPVTLTLAPREADFLRLHLETLNDLGVGISSLGADTFMIDALPTMVSACDAAAFLQSVANELHGGADPARRHVRPHHEAVMRTICHQAVRLGQLLGPDAWQALIEDLLACDLPYTCPLGRPTMILFSRAELERKFSRRP